MKKLIMIAGGLLMIAVASMGWSYPTVFPHGATLYKPDKAFSGYTLFCVENYGAFLIDMRGNVVHEWKNIGKVDHPVKLLPGGHIMGATGNSGRIMGHEDSNDLAIADWDGKIVWKYPKAGMHHDFERAGNPVGYYVPGQEPQVAKGKTLILSNKVVKKPRISDKPLLDDIIYIVDEEGQIIWDWLASDHIEEMGLSNEARNTLYRYPNYVMSRTPGFVGGDWIHVNTASWVGPNPWYDKGDERFHPDNIIYDGRQTNTTGIIDHKTGKIVWHLGPDFESTRQLREIGVTVGLHHAHVIPKGLPGEGNILIFDNGGFGGFGAPNPSAPFGLNNARREYSRIVELDPIKMKIVWEYDANKAGSRDLAKFFSDYVSSAQRLPNGNTLICEGAFGRLFEVTPEYETVWEYISPYYYEKENFNMVYRAYRVPYDYVPQLKKPSEAAIIPPESFKLRLKDLVETR
ncbi:MAG: aryl-sulfate sulfotransferase [Deltaproteobacteria bacterium]|nr:aryl-sulfate sulfotransferase [Deltaproteobacteria bacterium]